MTNFSNWTVGRRLIAGFGLSAITLVVIATIAYLNANTTIENEKWVDHSYQVRFKLASLISDVIDGETGVRGFVITGNESFLAPYKDSLTTITNTINDLRRLTADNPSQQQRLSELAPLIERKLAQFRARIDARRNEGFDGALKLVQTGESNEFTNKIRAVLADADKEEAGLLQKRSQDARNSANRTMSIILWGGLLGMLAVAAIGWFISRSLTGQIGSAVGQVRSSSTEYGSSM